MKKKKTNIHINLRLWKSNTRQHRRKLKCWNRQQWNENNWNEIKTLYAKILMYQDQISALNLSENQ